MDLIQHSISWCKGEIFEGKLSLIFGITILIIGIAYKMYASTPISKTMVWPLIIPALFAIATGVYLVSSNSKRIIDYSVAFDADASEFVEKEKARTDAFIAWYPITRYIMAGLVIIGMLLLMFSSAPLMKSIGVGLLVLGLYVFVLDLFSEERAMVYHEHIVNALSN